MQVLDFIAINLNRLIAVVLLIIGGAVIKGISDLPAIAFYAYGLVSFIWLAWLVLSAIEDYEAQFSKNPEDEK